MSAFVHNHPIVRELEPYMVVTDFNRAGRDSSPFGLTVPPKSLIDPTRMDSFDFLTLLQTLDARTFGPEGMPMDRWVFYTCCFMPGAIFGFARKAATLSDHAREVLEVPDNYVGLVPYSMYIAIPMASDPGDWMGHNLASISPNLPEEKLKGLGTLTKSVALKSFGTRRFYGATQWDSTALYIHTKVGPLDLHTAYTPAHSEAETLTYGYEVTDELLLMAAGAPEHTCVRPEPDMWIDATDVPAMIALQDRIEAGERFVIPDAPRRADGVIQVPVAVAS